MPTYRLAALALVLAFALSGCSLALDFDGYHTADASGMDGAVADRAEPSDGGGVDRTVADGGDEDGGGEDGGPPICSTGADCDDGVFCNGAESCDPSSGMADETGCVPGGGDPCLAGQMCDDDVDRCLSACEVDADADDDGYDELSCGGDDCDDADPLRNPAATEVCDTDARDEDCDLGTVGPDGDGDGLPASTCCNRVSGSPATCGTDCDDTMSTVSPSSRETCNGVDDDCNTMIDDGVGTPWYRDADRDNHGDVTMPMTSCTMPSGYVASSDDCDDASPGRYPGATETCNGIDDDCDTMVDDGVGSTWYRDLDGDTWGAMSATMIACTMPAGYVSRAGDCADGNAARNPGATETCNGIDDDCDTMIDDGAGTIWYRDGDGDGYGVMGMTMVACTMPAGYASRAGDCDDGNDARYPGATEICDTYDNDCNMLVDDGICTWGCGMGGMCDDPIQTAAGWEHQCVLRQSGRVFCVGSNESGELGVAGSAGSRSLAWIQVAGLPPTIRALSAGAFYTCALSGADEVWCWGANDTNQLGDGTTTSRHTPARVRTTMAGNPPLSGVSQISAGFGHACALSGTAVWCWGANGSEQLGYVGSGSRAAQVPGLAANRVSAGFSHTCVIDGSAAVQCWGSNVFGELGRGTAGGSSGTPMGVTGTSGSMISVTAGRWTSCAVRGSGIAFCWGFGTSGQIGDGFAMNTNVARQVSVVTDDFREVDCGYQSCCGLRATAHVACWGAGIDGAIGDGFNVDRAVPVETAGLHSYLSVETSGPWVSALMPSAVVRAWGFNGRGQLGTGTTTAVNVPTPVMPP